MPATHPALSEDLSTLQALVIAQQERLAERDAEIEHLKLIIAKLRRMQFGQSSEQLDATLGQLELSLEELETVRAEHAAQAAATETAVTLPTSPAAPAKRPGRKPLPDHLPRETVEHAPAECACPDCGGALKKLGEDVSEVLEFVPQHFKVMRHVRPKLACTACDTIVQAPAASRPMANGLAGPGLLAHVLTAKYCDHLPLYPHKGTSFGAPAERHLRPLGRRTGTLDAVRLGRSVQRTAATAGERVEPLRAVGGEDSR